MKIQEGSQVSIAYKLYVDDPSGEFIEEAPKEDPYQFIVGSGEQFEAFDKQMIGLSAGDTFSFALKSEEAYGAIDEEAIVEVPKKVFEHEGKIDEKLFELYNVLPMKDEEGNEFSGAIIAIQEDSITMDFNHPLAGEDVWFDGEILEVEE